MILHLIIADSKAPAQRRVAVSVDEFCETTKTSRSRAYELMRAGKLRFTTELGDRRIPVSEYVRLGLIEAASEEVPA